MRPQLGIGHRNMLWVKGVDIPVPEPALGYVLRIRSSIGEDGWDGEKRRWLEFQPELGLSSRFETLYAVGRLACNLSFRPVTRLNAIF
jgi:hypothetical protein